jgi:hypothetical protein
MQKQMAWSGISIILMVGVGIASAENKTWNTNMKGLQSALHELLVDLNSDTRFNSPANFKRIESNAGKLAGLAHDLKKNEASAPDSDPMVSIIASQFAKVSKDAFDALKTGQRGYARGMLKTMTGYCMACHTRGTGGPALPNIDTLRGGSKLRSLEKGDFYASTRQFDRALEEYGKVTSDSKALKDGAFDWEKAVRSSLAIAVRVKKDPDRALSIVKSVLESTQAPFFMKDQAAQWKLSLGAWKAEGPPKKMSEQNLYAQALRLVESARALQKYPADRSADILYLRASSAVHELLGMGLQGEKLTDALYLGGLCYEVMQDLYLWDQHEFLYLACIDSAPHTEKARQCFKHYEQSVYRGYTGSGGMHLPARVREKLRGLDLLSAPQSKTLPLQ